MGWNDRAPAIQDESGRTGPPAAAPVSPRRYRRTFGGRPEEVSAMLWIMTGIALIDPLGISDTALAWRLAWCAVGLVPIGVLAARDCIDFLRDRSRSSHSEEDATGTSPGSESSRIFVVAGSSNQQRLLRAFERAPRTLRVRCAWTPNLGVILSCSVVLYLVFDLDRVVSMTVFTIANYGIVMLAITARLARAARMSVEPGRLQICRGNTKTTVDLYDSKLTVDCEDQLIICARADGHETVVRTDVLFRPMRFAATVIRCATAV